MAAAQEFESSMKKPPIALLSCVLLAPILIAGCTLYKNPRACEARMRESLGKQLPDDKFSVSHVGVGIRGSRVVVEGAVEGPPAAPAATAASAPVAAVSASSTSAAIAAKLKKVSRPAAAECLFDGESLASIHWFSPPELTASGTAAASAP
jgi:hypothetical protein